MKTRNPEIFRNFKFEYRITLTYLVFGILWILFSDKVLDILKPDDSLLTKLQTFKGSFFIVVTSVFLYLLVKGHMQKLRIAETQRLESEFRFTKLWDNGPLGLMVVSKEFQYKNVNPEFCKILGYSEDELLQLTFKEISHPDDLVNDLPNIRKLINKEIPVYKTEKRYIRKDGQVIWGALTVFPNYDNEGNFLYNLAIVEDITERKLADEALQESSLRLELALNSSQSGVWDWDTATNKIVWSSQMFELFGADKNNADASFDIWRAALHPDDKESAELKISDAIKNHISLQNEYRVVLPDGKIRWINVTGETLFDTDGQPLRMIGICKDITEQKMADEKIRQKDMEFRKLSANVPDLIYQFTRKPDGSYCVPVASEGIRNIFGCTPEEVLDDFTPIGRVIYPEDAERVIRDIEYSAKNLTHFTCEFRVQIPGREIQWLYSNSTPEKLPDGSVTWYGFNVDITHKKLAEEALKEESSRLDLAMQIANMAWWEMDISTGNVTFDKRKATMLGYIPENFTHYNDFTALVHPEDFDKAMNAMKMHLGGFSDKYEVEYRIMNSTGAYKWFYDIGAIVKKDIVGAPLNIIGFVVDISARKYAEDEIRKLNETLEHRVSERTSQLEAVNKELEAFSYSVSHDLRSPLRHINGFAEILMNQYSENLPGDARKHLNTITGAAKKMGTLIDDLLSFSRTGRAELRKSTFNMNSVVDEALVQIKPSIVNRKIDWNISQLPEIYGDYNLMRQVWINLIDNAVKYSQKRENAVIEIGYNEGIREIIYYIRDNGVGFDMKYADKLFGVFQRLHSSSQFDGTGVGLANVQRIIFRHGGKTWAEAETDKGAAFYFSIPK